MKKIILLFILTSSFLWSSCEKHKLRTLPDLPEVEVEANNFQWMSTSSGFITGNLVGLGDGIKEVGHVWSTTNNTPTIANSRDGKPGNFSLGEFSSEANLLDPNSTYFFKAYAIDVHDRIIYSENTTILGSVVQASFTVDKTLCTGIPCQIEFTNTSVNGLNYTWNFNDGSPQQFVSNDDPIVHTFNKSGIFNIELIVEGTNTTSDTFSLFIEIRAHTFALPFPNFFEGKRVFALQDGSYAMAGTDLNSDKIFLIKTDKTGEINPSGFEKTFSNSNLSNYYLADAIQLGNGEFMLLGSAYNPLLQNADIFYVKTDLNGNGSLTNDLGSGVNNDLDQEGKALTQISDGSIVIISNTMNPTSNENDMFIIKFNPDFSYSFFPHFIPIAGGTEDCTKIISGGNSDFVLIENSGSTKNPFFVKLNSSGNLNGAPLDFGGSSTDEELFSVIKTPDDQLFFTGLSFDSGNGDILLLKSDLVGNSKEDISSVGDNSLEIGYDLVYLEDENQIVVAGTKGGKPYLQKLTTDGIIVMDTIYSDFIGDGYFNDIEIANDGGFILAGSISNTAYLIKTDSNFKIY